MELREFLHMGGYAGYVWTAYGLSTLVLVLNWVSARRTEAEQRELAMRRMASDKEART
ncbi:MAG TPA: heme exporter protein CcmD [Steroidobacteraceae bacterium]|jgi:heme exporter protein D|nr:heme exporter protein CcmD [Steroidobacteraceae bacterium]